MRWAVVAAVTLIVSPSAYAQPTPALPGVRMIELDGRAVRVQAIGLQERRPGEPVIVFEAGASNALEIWGGMLARYFAGYYPADVVGLVLVDPSPLVTESQADNLSPFEKIGAGRAGFDAYWSSFSALLAKASPAVRAENEVLRGLLEMDLAAREGALIVSAVRRVLGALH